MNVFKSIIICIIICIIQLSHAFASFDHTGAFLSSAQSTSSGQYSNMGMVGETFVNTISYGVNLTLKTGFIHQMDNPRIISKIIELVPGFQFFSLPLEPQQKDLQSIFKTILDQVDFIKDTNGNFFRKIGSQWIDNIGLWTPQSAYLIKMINNATLSIQGVPVQNNVVIPLKQGYSIVPYYGQSYNAIDAFGEILMNLNFARNSKGHLLRKINNDWIDNIGQLCEWDACLLRMNHQDVLQYDRQAKRKRSNNYEIIEKDVSNRHFELLTGNPAESIWSIYVEKATINDKTLEPGDEIAVFDGDQIVGSMVVSEVFSQETRYNNYLTVWSKLTDGKGYIEGYPCTFAFWDKSEQIEYSPIDIEFVDIKNSYSQNIFPTGDGQFSVANLSYSQLFAEMQTEDFMYTHSDAIPITLVFSREIENFQGSDILIKNGRLHGFKRYSLTTYCFNVSPINEGNVEINLSDNLIAAHDLILRTSFNLCLDENNYKF